MEVIRTVTGDISTEQLGWCQCHEHIFIADGPSRKVNEALYMDDYKKSLKEVLEYKEAGGRSFVDAQPYGCGRMAKDLLQVSRQTGVNIIACTGFHKTEFFEDTGWLERQSEDSLTRIYIREVDESMDRRSDMKAKAGIIKCAAVKGTYKANKVYGKLFSAAANAAHVTGTPLLVHFDPGADAYDLIGFFARNNIETDRLIFCHLDRTQYDIAYHKELAQAGVYLEYDTIHREKNHSDEDEALLIESMVNEGYVSRLLLGLDTTNKRLKRYGGAFGLDDILIRFKFVLERRLGKNIIDILMVDNPKIALSFKT